eukprot:jgi/Botrbrau1/9690/Bobra.0201s0020.1
MNTAVPDIAAICEKKKTSFRAYLEASGIFDVLVRVLVTLYEEDDKPENAESYLRSLLGAPTVEEHKALQQQKEKLEQELEELKKELHAREATPVTAPAA